MRTLFTLIFSVFSAGLMAQNATDWEWFKSVPQMSETSEMRSIAADDDGNVYVMGFISEPFSPSESGFAMAKYDGNGNQLWTYNVPGLFGNAWGDCDADGNLYVVMKYTETELVVEGETLATSDLALMKLDKDGTFQFAKAIGSDGLDEVYQVQFEDSEVLVSAYGQTNFDRDGISFTIPQFGRALMMAFDADGMLTEAGVTSASYLDEPSWITNEGGTYYAYVPRQNVRKYRVDPATQTPVVSAELNLENQNNGFQLKVMDVVSTSDDRIYATGFFKSDYVLLEGDTIHSLNNGFPTCFILELDTGLRVQNSMIYYDVWGFQNQDVIQKLAVYKDEKIAVKNWFASTLYFPDDSLVSWNNQRAASVVELDVDLNVGAMAQVNVWDEGGWDSWDLEYDGLGNLFALFQHEEDMYYDSVQVPSANKSWAHLSVLSKLGTGDAAIGITEASSRDGVLIFPNPARDFVYLQSEAAISEVRCYDLSGKLCGQWMRTASLDVKELPAGVYSLQIEAINGGRSHQKFVKVR